MIRRISLVLVTVLAALDLAAQPAYIGEQIPGPVHVIPVVGKIQGGFGTNWVSDVTISNVSTREVSVGAYYFKANVANEFEGTFSRTFTLPSRGTVLAKDAVGSWFPAAGGSTLGFLVLADVTPVNCSAETKAPLVVTSRTYNAADPSKTYGQTIPSAVTAVNYTAGRTILTGIRQEPGVPGYRSNLGVVNLSEIRITVTITFYTANGTVAGSATRSVEPLSLTQWSLADLGIDSLPSTGAWASVFLAQSDVRLDPCTTDWMFCLSRCDQGCEGSYAFARSGTFIAYISKIDNGSGDAEFIPGVVDWTRYNESCGDSARPPLLE